MKGIGVLINELGGDASGYKIYQAALNKIIERAWVADNRLYLLFSDKSQIRFYDNGQSCCEDRYMSTDDNLDYFAGAVFLKAEVRGVAETSKDGYGEEHEIQFLLITTDKGVFTMANHNVHNGYYGGFSLVCAGLR